jgi:addiction module HigA family antidote
MTKRKPTHPGLLLKEDVLIPLGLSITEAANDLGVSRKTLSELVNEKSSLSPDMAIRIAKATNTSPESWLNMQTKLDLWESDHKKLKVIPFPVLKDDLNQMMQG